jgi:ornithine lipid hydroxylase
MNSHPKTLPSVVKSFTQPNSNYGNALLVWDHLFGSFRPAQASSALVVVGLFESRKAYPATHSYWQQVRSMFSPACCKVAN